MSSFNPNQPPSINLETEIAERLSIPEKDFPASEVCFESKKGSKNARNEDSGFTGKLAGREMIGVFDGVGGREGGKEASGLAVDFTLGRYRKLGAAGINEMSLEDAAETMAEALRGADEYIHDEALKKGNGMVTTAALTQMWHDPETGEMKLVVAYVGDSRVLIVRKGKIRCVTLDDSTMWGKMPRVEAKKLQNKFSNVKNQTDLSDEELGMWKKRNEISKALGHGNTVPTIEVVDLCAGDVVLTCTDGLTDNLTENEIKTAVNVSKNASQMMSRLTLTAEERSKDGGHLRRKPDDITIGIIKTPELTPEKISKTEDITELLAELRKYDGIWGSDGQKYHTFEQVYDTVKGILGGKAGADEVTRSSGLRDKVKQLLSL